MTLSHRGTHANLGLPGTGLSWRGRIDGGTGRRAAAATRPGPAAAPTAPPAPRSDGGAGKSALAAALAEARTRRPFSDAFAGVPERAAGPGREPARPGNPLIDGRIGRAWFLVGLLALSGLAVVLVGLADRYPRDVTDNALALGLLALAAIGILLIAARSRAAGVLPWVTFLGLGLAAYLAPVVVALILVALLLAPGKERPTP